MSDLLQRLAAANPVADDQRPPIQDVWRKVAQSPASAPRAWRHTGRGVIVAVAVTIPVLAVLALALSLGGVRSHTSNRTVPGARPAHSTIDPNAQRVALAQLRGRAGSIAVLNPRTGSVEAFASTTHGDAQVLPPPAATFDVVTAAAALDSGRYTPASRISGRSPLGARGSLVRNDDDQTFGRLTLADALSASVNTVFARVGTELGPAIMTTYMRRFGFYALPDIDGLPASGARPGGALVLPTSDRVALGPLAAGGGGLTATALQMAMVAAAVANRGILANPHLTTPTPAGGTRRVMSSSTARELVQMLRRVVARGTGTAANLSGLQVAGKTGTARMGGAGSRATAASFIAFAPADHPTIAIAVLLTDPHGGLGGTEAAPIAAHIIRALLSARR